MFPIVSCSSKSDKIVGKQVHCNWNVTFTCEAVAHPAIAGAEIKNSELLTTSREDTGKNMSHDVTKCSGTLIPLLTVATGQITKRKGKVVFGVWPILPHTCFAALIFLHEVRKVSRK